ncbi:alpha-L-rhamnosidase [Streptomyces sp. NPDC047072]|uniref:alpha-L-rhamnosidase-related protein n=1 Tax=Streptomyces sp. NPDC047072 TaxID=3154809 RepID=UPI0033D7D27A
MRRLFGLALATATMTATALAPPAEASPPATTTASATANAVSQAAVDPLAYAPTSRTLKPAAVYATSGSVANPQNVLSGQATRISGSQSAITLDFGKEVGGVATLSFGSTSDNVQRIGLAFSESSLYVGTNSDRSSGRDGEDGALYTTAAANGTYTMPTAQLRGGFRYLTVFVDTSGWVDLKGVSLGFTADPEKANPADYPNYFHSSDDLLNRIWYAGAYTVQLNTIASNQGRAWPPPASAWDSSATVGVGDSVLVDGAKRDRTVWPGDLGIAVPTQYAYAGAAGLAATRNALSTMYDAQSAEGEIPWSGPVFNLTGSDTYHTWTLLGTSTYYTYSGDRAWLDSEWTNFKRGMAFILGKVDGNNLLNVTRTQDWARVGQGGENISANALLFAALKGGATLAAAEGDSALAASWINKAAAIRTAANSLLWDASKGMYKDNPTSGLYPQDGNSLAVWYGLTDSTAKAKSIVAGLGKNWGAYGPTTPEWGGNVSPFAGGMELNARFAANDDYTALDQIRRTWGHMLDSDIGTKSTFWEGVKADGGLAYGGSFMSLAHGWSTAPTSTLTFDVLGIAPESVANTYRFVPHPGDLANAQGRITMPQGAVDASWSRDRNAGTYWAQLTSPAGTTGRIGIPKSGGTVTVAVNGTTVWSNGTFTPTTGITGASQDDTYVYLTGVAPGSYTVTASGLGNPAEPNDPAASGQLKAGFTRCAGEGGACSFSGTRSVAYGAGTYTYKTVTGGTPCTSASFGGDPAANILKSCYVADAGGPPGYTVCASENGTCSVPGYNRDVAYGGNGNFAHQVTNGSVACTNAHFGDPIDGVAKSCYVAGAGAPPGYTLCVAEAGTCPAVAGQPVAYGAYGAFTTLTASGDTPCTNAVFGDPIPGESKSCYTATGGPSGYATSCSAEGGTCAFSGQRTVAYGARGRFLYKSFTGGASCTTAAFGTDPLPGVLKSCYLTP